MKSYGIDVKIVLNTNLMGEKAEWIGSKLGADWIERVIAINVRYSPIIPYKLIFITHIIVGQGPIERRLFY